MESYISLICRLVEALTPYNINETFIYKLVKERRADVIAAVYNNEDLGIDVEPIRSLYKEFCDKQKGNNGTLLKREFGTTFSVDGDSRYYSNSKSLATNWIPDLCRTCFTKTRLHSLISIGRRYNPSFGGCSNSTLEINIGILLYEGIINDKEAYDVRALADIKLGFNDFYRYFHEQLFGSLQEQMERLNTLSEQISDLQKQHEIQMKELEMNKDAERDKAIAEMKARASAEAASANKHIDDLEHELDSTKKSQSLLTIELDDTKAKNKELASKVFALEQENSKLKTQLKSIFSIRDSLDETTIDIVAKVSEHDERLNTIENTVEEQAEELIRKLEDSD